MPPVVRGLFRLAGAEQQRGTITFSNSGDESITVKDTNADYYGVYASWDAGSKSGNCNATGGAGSSNTCSPLCLAENLQFYVVACSKNYSGGVLVDSKCNSRFSYGTT